jgi:hypothetical protein
MKYIKEIKVKREVDYNTDLRDLGEFSDTEGEYAIEHGLEDCQEYNYFNAENVSSMKEAKENYERIMKYERGELVDYGIIAEATIVTEENTSKGYGLTNTIHSGGLWGMSSDSDESYLKEIENEQIEELKEILKEFGFTQKEIEKAKVEREF